MEHKKKRGRRKEEEGRKQNERVTGVIGATSKGVREAGETRDREDKRLRRKEEGGEKERGND